MPESIYPLKREEILDKAHRKLGYHERTCYKARICHKCGRDMILDSTGRRVLICKEHEDVYTII